MSLALIHERGLFFPAGTRLYELIHSEEGTGVLAIYSITVDAWGMRRADGAFFYESRGEVVNDLWFLGPEWAAEVDLIKHAIEPEGWVIAGKELVR